MISERAQALCRPDETHWCSECCESRDCLNFNQLKNGIWGCLGYDIKKNKIVKTLDGLIQITPQFEKCRQIDCLDGIDLNRQEVEKRIKTLPLGEFYMSMVIKELSGK